MGRFFLAFAAILVTSTATFAQTPLKVVGTTPLPGEPMREQIALFFNQPVTLPEGEQWFTVSPDVSGTVRTGEHFLAFKPDDVTAQRVITFALNPAIQSQDGATLPAEQREWTFATFAFEPQNVWNIEDGPVLGISFPASVATETLRDRLTIETMEGKELDYTLSTENNEVFRIRFEEALSGLATITVDAGLRDVDDRFIMADEWSTVYPESQALKLERVEWDQYEKNDQVIRFVLNHAVETEALEEHLTITNRATGEAVPITFDEPATGRYHFGVIHLDDPSNADLTITVEKGLRGEEGAQLAVTQQERLQQRAPRLAVNYAYFNQSRDGRLELYMRLSEEVTAESFREHIEVEPKLPEMAIAPEGRGGFRIQGEWSSNTMYTFTLKEGAEYWAGATLDRSVSHKVKTDEIRPYLDFGHEGKYYFPRRTGGAMPIESRNVGRATVSLSRVFPSNIPLAIDDIQAGAPDSRFVNHWSEPVAEVAHVIPMQRDKTTRSYVDISNVFPENARGVFCLTVTAPKANTARKAVILTDIGALARWKENALVIFAHDLMELTPLVDAKVTIYSSKNQKLGEGMTGDQGMVRFSDFDEGLGQPKVAVIEKENDFTVLDLRDTTSVEDAIDGSMPLYDAKRYDAFIYADRELYRPGDTVHLHWSVRQNYGDAAGEMPLLLKIIKPTGQPLLTQTTTLSEYGTDGIDLSTEQAYPTGAYHARLFVPGDEQQIGEYTFQLEDFVPNRMKAEVEMAEGVLASGTEYGFTVNAQHLFGAPAQGRRAEGKVYLERTAFESEEWPGFVFNNDAEFQPDPIDVGEAQTDEDGGASFAFTYEPRDEVTFPLKATIVGRVYELGGRAIGGRVERTLFPEPTLLGVAAQAASEPGQVNVQVAAINADESAADMGTVKVSLEKEVWIYNVRRYQDYYEPNWVKEFEEVETRGVSLADGRGATSFPVRGWGYYRARVHAPDKAQYSTVTFYVYGDQIDVVDPSRPSLIKLTADKEDYTPGDTARVRVEAPFDGKVVAAVVGPELRQLAPVDIVNESAMLEVPLTESHVPNAWVDVTVVHAMQDSAPVHPFSSVARINLPVKPPKRKLDIALRDAPEAIRPESPLRLNMKVTDAAGNPVQAEITVAAVDEGIHLITDYETPDPYAYFLRPRRPQYNRAHYYDKVAYDFQKMPIGGGGVGRQLAQRVPFVGESWIKPVALWSGAVTTDDNGEAEVSFDVPEFTGQLRLAVVANGMSGAGSIDENVYIRRPYMLQTSMPRFLLPGDEAQCRAVVYNTTDESVEATMAWSTSGAITAGQGDAAFTIPPNGEKSLTAFVSAGDAHGQGALNWSAEVRDSGGNVIESLSEEAPIPVHPPATYRSDHELIVLGPDEDRAIDTNAYIEGSMVEWDVTAGASPALRLQEALAYLADYPYGCIEQTTSRLMPLYLMRQEAELVGSILPMNENYESYIQYGIDRLLAMQTYSGGLSMWPGSTEAYDYGSIYALHFLTLVEEDPAFDVPRDAMEELRRFVRRIALDESRDERYELYTRAYATYALALNREIGAVAAIERFTTVTLPVAARDLLTAALAMNTNDADRISRFAAGPTTQLDARLQGGTLNSPIRNKAIRLMRLQAMNAPESERAAVARELVDYLSGETRRNTHETAFVATALGNYFTGLRENLGDAFARIVTPTGAEQDVRGDGLFTHIYEGTNATYRAMNSGGIPIYINVTTRGVLKEAVTEAVTEGVGVLRQTYLQDGSALDTAVYRQGDSYIIGVKVRCENPVENLVLVERLPAGFEIENPRLNATAVPGGAFEEAATPSYLDLRDDRLIAAFDDLDAGNHTLYYIIRAVTPGSYDWPAAEAECMYAPHIHGNSAPSTIDIQ